MFKFFMNLFKRKKKALEPVDIIKQAIEKHNLQVMEEEGFKIVGDDYGMFIISNGMFMSSDGSFFISDGKGTYVIHSYVEEKIAKA